MPFTIEELAAFSADGIVVKRGLVPYELVERAAARVTNWYDSDMDYRQLVDYTNRSFAPGLGNHPDLLALFAQSGLADLVSELIGDFAPITTTQIQIRIPDSKSDTPQPSKAMHVDGVACPHLDPAELRTFSLLVGVVLSDTSDPAGGALHYVPGGHLSMAEWFRTKWSLGLSDQVPPYMAVEQGVPFLGKCGDALLMHHLVPHAVGRNRTDKPRIMAYFRVSHVDHASHRLDALRDPWLDFPALLSRHR